MKIKILHCITDLSADGAQRVLLRLVSSMNSEQFEHEIISLLPGGALLKNFEQSGVKVSSCNMRPGIPDPTKLFRLIRLIRKSKPDVIQAWMYHSNFACSIANVFGRFRIPILWNLRRCLYNVTYDDLLKRAVNKMSAALSRRATRIVYCVKICAEQHEALGYDSQNRVVITNGFDTKKYAPYPDSREKLFDLLQIPPSKRLVGIVGRYHPQKDFPNFLKAVKIVTQSVSDVHFAMIGKGLDSENPELKELISQLGVRENVELLGQREDVHQLMSGFDLWCSSSENEGFANVVGEAMSCGVPCVVTDAGASRELVEGIGIVVPRQDPEALAAGLKQMLGCSRAELKNLGEKSRERITGEHSLESMVQKYENLYREVVAEFGSRRKQLLGIG